MNPRITKKDKELLKGAARRVFGRSELRKGLIDRAIVKGYKDPKRKAVKFWVQCTECKKMEAKSNVQLDHRDPVIPVTSSLEEMEIAEVIDRIWCDESNLDILCLKCHRSKTKMENAERRRTKKERQK